MHTPFFLIGSERSGSTMLRLMLDHHPQLACNLESDFLVSQLDDDGRLPAMASYHAFLRQDRVFRHSRFEIDERLDYTALVNDFLEQKRRRDGKQQVGATVHHDFHRLPRLWPDARYVYLLRDGRDVANSAVGMGWAGNAYCGADLWLEAEARWHRMREGITAENYIEVRFEDLVSSPVETLTAVCRFLGVPFSDAMLAYPDHSTYGAPDGRLASQWRTRMAPSMRGFVEARIGDQLHRRGYPLSAPGAVVSGPRDLLLRIDSKIGCVRDRVRRFGLPLTLGDFAARRLGIRRWQATTRARCDAIIDGHLK
jgi:hypothetical protein